MRLPQDILTQLQLLAWNGGGSSNYSEIVKDASIAPKVDKTVEKAQHLQKFLEAEVEELKGFFEEL